uniref:Venom peptide n=1 Tax=Comana monomorpha TaxID=1555636 RepID=A0AAU6PBD9_9NEOP
MNYLLLLLPVLAQARISIKMVASTKENVAKIEYDGREEHVITDKDRDTFGLSDGMVKTAVNNYFGERPTDVYLKSKTPWGDLYEKYNWPQVRLILSPIQAKVLGVQSEPVIINSQEFSNNSTEEAKFTATISQTIEDTVSNSWSKGGEFTLGQEISYSCEFAGVGVSGTTSMSYTASWGQETSKSKSLTVGSSTGVEVTVKPGKATQVSLTATRGTMDAQVDYKAKLEGSVVCNYENTFKNHHFWSLNVNSLLPAVGLPKEIASRETMKIGFYSNVNANVQSV